MKKSFLIGFGVGLSAIAAGYVYWQRLGASQQDQLAVKLDDTLASGRDKATMLESKAALNAQNALASLKDSTSKLKGHLDSARESIEYDADVMDGDIVIDHRSAFSKAKQTAEQEDVRPTEKFYPHNN